jgi:hypothetical protein
MRQPYPFEKVRCTPHRVFAFFWTDERSLTNGSN